MLRFVETVQYAAERLFSADSQPIVGAISDPPELSTLQPHWAALPRPSPATSAEAGPSRQAAGARRAARRRLRSRAALSHVSLR
jgi:hypothetical protein